VSSEFPKGRGRATSIPPAAAPRLDRARLRFLPLDETQISIAFETSLLGFADTTTSIDLDEEPGAHRARGRVAEVSPGRLVLANPYGDLLQIRVRVPGLDLTPLLSATLSVQISHRPGPERPTIDAVFRDTRGALVLWARDGAPPGGRGAMGVTVRLARDAESHVFEVSGRSGTLSLRAGMTGDTAVGLSPVTFAALRVGHDDAAFFAVRL
jgi:hypothetical protein